jgi:transposase
VASLQKKLVKGHYYWYIVESKRINGKPTPVPVAYLGNIENMLRIFNNQTSDTINSDKDYKSYLHGSVSVMWDIADKLKISKILDSVFPAAKRNGLSKGRTILLAAIHRAIDPGSKNEFSDWSKQTTLPGIAKFDPMKLNSQHFWQQMDGITEEMLIKAEDLLIKEIFKSYKFSLEKIALDYTNYFTYIDSENKNSNLTHRGHNKQKRKDLRQFSLALFTTKELMLPLCSYVYEGNTNDVTIFPKYFGKMKERISKYYKGEDFTLVFDKGSISKENLKLFDEPECKYKYVCSFSLSYCKELMGIPLDNYTWVDANEKKHLCYRISKVIWGKERTCILMFSEDLKTGQINGFDSELVKKIEGLKYLKEQIKSAKSRISKKVDDIKKRIDAIIGTGIYSKVILIEYTGKRVIKDITYTIDIEAKESVFADYGKKLLITNRKDWSTEEIIETYLQQSSIEKIFKDTKNPYHFTIRPQHHWTDQKVRVHTFCCLLGLMLTVLIRKQLLGSGIKIENERLLDILSRIRQLYILKPSKKAKSGFDVEKTLEKMSDEEEKIWSILHTVNN